MQVFNYDPTTGVLLGTSQAQESPLEPGKFLIPAHATTNTPPAAQAGFDLVFLSGKWVYQSTVLPEAPPTTEPVLTDDQKRHAMSPLTRRQLLLGLLSIGIHEADVDAKVAQLPADQVDAAQITWKYASEYRRDDPLVSTLATAFALPANQVDDLWTWAAAL